MDIYCPRCGEPWEIDSLHDRLAELNPSIPWVTYNNSENTFDQKVYEEKYFNPIVKRFRSVGCEVFDAPHGEINSRKNGIYGALLEFAGDDIDFAASMMEDAQSFGLFDNDPRRWDE